VAVLIPCFNEELTIAEVVEDFKANLPHANIYVYDNNSTDETVRLAASAGAIVRSEPLQGKGHVVRRMFADIEADIYVLVDGDGTYDPQVVVRMARELLNANLDMVTGTREYQASGSYRAGHRLGNRVLNGAVRTIFGARISDMLSGYRVFSRRFVKSFPALATGFETETEFTVHALELAMPVGEVQVRYGMRPVGSRSKLHTIRDGIRISQTILGLVMRERPLQFFAVLSIVSFIVGIALGTSVVTEFVRTGIVPRLPTAVLAASLVLLAFINTGCGLIMDAVAHGRREAKRMCYLSFPAPTALRKVS
jgi:glycosyltransferase involved in cell wall biosynthesis